MSEASGSPEEKPASSVKKSIAARLTEGRYGLELPDDVKEKITEIASKQGKKEVEVYQEIVAKGLASASEDLAYMLARKKVIDSLTPSEQMQVLKNVEAYMKGVQSVFGTWRETPTPTTTQPPTTTVQPTASQPAQSTPTSNQGRPFIIPADQVEKATQEILKKGGLPDISIPQPTQGTQQTNLSQGSVMTLAIAKYAIDKLGTTAVSSLLNNPKIQDSIAEFIKKVGSDPRLGEILGGLLGDLSKLTQGEEKPPP